jgi:cytochrome c553
LNNKGDLCRDAGLSKSLNVRLFPNGVKDSEPLKALAAGRLPDTLLRTRSDAILTTCATSSASLSRLGVRQNYLLTSDSHARDFRIAPRHGYYAPNAPNRRGACGRLPELVASPDSAAASKTSPTTPATGAKPSTRTAPKGLAGASPAVKRGKSLYVTMLCATCHSSNGARLIGPTHLNLLGREETLADGSRIIVDEAYLRESILDPQKRIVKDFPPIMPAMKDKLTAAQLEDLIAYLKFLSPDAGKPTSRPDRSSGSILSNHESALAEIRSTVYSRFLLSPLARFTDGSRSER